ncbi:esterase [Novosphingobium sp. FSY-8]|uniref:Esterase n=1 Tax=Novosphingobium ovatum TaxID=1908523 RepID=A0ABW9XGN2_9SPHN|nr:alpha/beta hydrolase-fold protein [Novosphingobium ovatum]NBC37577.1 esterase [Novosphingobium ovatum]
MAQPAPTAATAAQPAAPPACPTQWFAARTPPFASTQVGADGQVTFRICAPAAQKVEVTSDIDLLPRPAGAFAAVPLPLKRDATGLWSATTPGPVTPGTHRFSFRVDGVKTADPFGTDWAFPHTGVDGVLQVPGASAAFQAYDPGIAHGVVSTITYESRTLGMTRRAHVYTPPGYMKDARRYPVLYLVHGAGDSDDSWISTGHAHWIMDRLIAAKKAVPMIIVMPDGHTPDRPEAMMWTNHDFGNDLTRDLIPYVDANFRTIPTADARGMAGLSMGGQHTLREGVNRPDTFHWIGVFSIGLGVARTADIHQDKIDDYMRENDAALKRSARDMRLVYFAMGRDDFLYHTAAPTRAVFDRYHIGHLYRETGGGHTWMNWRDYLADFAPRLFRPTPAHKGTK